MKKIILGLLVIALIVPAAGLAKKKEKDLLGVYSVKGYDPGIQTSGEPSYTGLLEVSQSGGAYLLNWKLGLDGKKTRKGVGVYTDGVFSVAFDGGVVSYKVEKKSLKGVWAPFAGGKFGFEFCERQ